MANGDDSWIHLILEIWTGVLTTLGGLFWWNFSRMADTLDRKAEKEEVATLREDIALWRADQQQQHAENRQRLDMIMQALGRRR